MNPDDTIRRKQPRGQYAPVRSVRVTDAVWNAAKARADAEGVTMSTVLGAFVAGYANHQIGLPTVTVTFEDQQT